MLKKHLSPSERVRVSLNSALLDKAHLSFNLLDIVVFWTTGLIALLERIPTWFPIYTAQKTPSKIRADGRKEVVKRGIFQFWIMAVSRSSGE